MIRGEGATMTFHHFEAPQAFTGGSELWLVADLNSSLWASKIDWYLNFQLARAQVHNSPDISRELSEIAARWDFDIKTQRAATAAPLLIASGELVPNLKTVVVPFRTPGKCATQGEANDSREPEWALRCFKIWKQLGCPKSRVFLPDELKPESFAKKWTAALVEGETIANSTIEIVRAPQFGTSAHI